MSRGSTERIIIHVDMDAFYASVEQRDCPELRGRPVVVGGVGARGVVAAASYEARRFGIHSAMPARRARELCPDAVFLRPRMSDYQAESRRVFEVFHRYTPLVEALSLDEAFLDVTGSRRLFGDRETIGRGIKAAILAETGLVASVGIAPNKFVAKLASDQDKPDGLCVVVPEAVASFVGALPVERMWGIGRKAAPRIAELGVRTIGDLGRCPIDRLARVVGRVRAEHFHRLAAGLDDRPVVAGREDKSISNELTFDEDLTTLAECRKVLLGLSQQVGRRLRAKALRGRTAQVKIRSRDFQTWTRSRSSEVGLDGDQELTRVAYALMESWWEEFGPTAIRLLGFGVSQLQPAGQGDLFANSGHEVDKVRDQIEAKYGLGAVKPARLLDPDPND
ncbi:MAG: DNA polymerase IV [Xanthomonadales bacterium]|nr:DNA polymerase IV [Xanthomonadales bacterium]